MTVRGYPPSISRRNESKSMPQIVRPVRPSCVEVRRGEEKWRPERRGDEIHRGEGTYQHLRAGVSARATLQQAIATCTWKVTTLSTHGHGESSPVETALSIV